MLYVGYFTDHSQTVKIHTYINEEHSLVLYHRTDTDEYFWLVCNDDYFEMRDDGIRLHGEYVCGLDGMRDLYAKDAHYLGKLYLNTDIWKLKQSYQHDFDFVMSDIARQKCFSTYFERVGQ